MKVVFPGNFFDLPSHKYLGFAWAEESFYPVADGGSGFFSSNGGGRDLEPKPITFWRRIT